jgi:hypothetical protein
MAPVTAGHFGHSVLAPKGSSTRVPTQITCQTFKERPHGLHAESRRASHACGCAPAFEGAGSISVDSRPSTFFFAAPRHSPRMPGPFGPRLRGARSIAPMGRVSTEGAGGSSMPPVQRAMRRTPCTSGPGILSQPAPA